MRAGRLRSFAQYWRPSETGAALATRATTYANTGTVWIEFVEPRRGLADYGAGETTGGGSHAEMRAPAQVLARDVLLVTEGPHAGERWRVEGLVSPDMRKVIAALVPFNGTLP